MTVCIAAIHEYNTYDEGVVVVTDRLFSDLSTGRTHESAYPKIFQISNFVVGLAADDMDLQAELMTRTRQTLLARKEQEEPTVQEVFDHYSSALMEKTHRYFERNVLANLGLTLDHFHKEQSTFHPSLVEKITEEMMNYAMPFGVQTIIAGQDPNGRAQICVFDGRDDSWRTERGYAAIGSGWEPAEGQFALGRFNKEWRGPEVGFLCYVGKRRAEVMSGVGRDTDIRVINKYGTLPLTAEVLKELEEQYETLEQGIKQSEEEIRVKLRPLSFIPIGKDFGEAEAEVW
jgi:20S proteasome alpha/beta subunit